ncbi:MAG: hypothetical protein IJE10_11260 [Clostridia bacterium]|nr:hypothetical protein [Clostridia bacterium]
MKKFICILISILMLGITSSAQEAVDTDYVNIKQAVLQYVSAGEYQKAVECIDLYGYTVQSNDWYYNDLQNDRVAISEVIHAPAFRETLTMLQTLSRLQRYELGLVYIGEQKEVFDACPNFIKQLDEWADYFNGQLKKSRFSGTYQGDGMILTASVDDMGTVIESLKVQKGDTEIVLADATTRGYVYTERNENLQAEGTYFDNLQNSGVICVSAEGDILTVEITADGYGALNASGTYVLSK